VSQPAELRQKIEDLALQSILGDAGGTGGHGVDKWLAAFQAIHSLALTAGAAELADIAQATMESLTRVAPGSEETAATLQDGIARLQRSLEAADKQTVASTDSLAGDPELLSDFVLEAREHLASLEAQVLTIERDPGNSEALNSVFRSFHTIKGLAGFLELWEIQKLAHEVETVLDKARNFQLTITPGAIDVILESADYLRGWLTHLETTLQQQPSTPPARDENLLQRVAKLSAAAPGPAEPSPGLAELATVVETGATPPAPAAPPPPPDSGGESPKRNEKMAVKVDTGKLDYLVDMAGEMVIAETLVRHDPELSKLKNQRLQRNLQQLTRITAELQKTAMAMRLVPIGPLFKKMARLVRDLSRQCGKSVELETQGDEIELDRTIVEELGDPLMHMVRNSLDHGIEPADQREALGKPGTARLLLKAHHQAGQVVIEITDDGRGLNREKIVAKAMEKGLIASADQLPDKEIYDLIFAPGFSTAAQVTNVSGRGVGMDVVRRGIEKLRGRIEIQTLAGQGTTFVLKLPLTLAIIDGLVVGVGKERYIVPLFAVREMFRPKSDTLWTVQQRGEMALVRGMLLPVLRLYRKFGVKPRSENPLDSVVVVAEAGSQRFCLVVDELIGKQEVVIKSLGETFKDSAGVAGGAIMGDGRVGLILDLDRLYKDKAGDAGR
jgi:two-component system, chemotaxis family, sensor kinase CheA